MADDPIDTCPDFDLAPLEGFAPGVLLDGRQSADALVLVLALAFNDIKGLMWLVQQLTKHKPAVSALSAKVGQWAGMNFQTRRIGMGILFELLEALSAADKKGLLDDPQFVAAVATTGPGSRKAWAQLVAAARMKAVTGDLKPFLETVRNRCAFHYDRTLLWDGYEKRFAKDPKTQLNEKAYCSIGKNMEETRWFFADSAVEGIYKQLDPDGSLFKEADAHIKAMNLALKHIVQEYLRLKATKQPATP